MPCSISVTSPVSSDAWQRGTSHNITWTSSSCSDFVQIALYKGGSLEITLTPSTSNDGSYSWTVQSNLSAGTDYTIRVIDEDSGNYGESAQFEITTASATSTHSDTATLSDTKAQAVKAMARKSYVDNALTSETLSSAVKHLPRITHKEIAYVTDTHNARRNAKFTETFDDDKVTLSDSLEHKLPVKRTYKDTATTSDSATARRNAKFTFTFSDTATVTDDPRIPARITQTYSDTATLSETFGKGFGDAFSDSVTTSETLSTKRAVEVYFIDTANTAEVLSSQDPDEVGFYYDSIGLAEAAITQGYVLPSSGDIYFNTIDTAFDSETRGFNEVGVGISFDSLTSTFSGTSQNFNNIFASTVGQFVHSTVSSDISYLTDQSVGAPASFSGASLAGARINLGSAKSVNFIAFYVRDPGASITVKLYGSNSLGDSYTELVSTRTLSTGWVVAEFAEESYPYYVYQLDGLNIGVEVSEVIIGQKFLPDIRFDLNNVEGYQPRTQVDVSFSGSEFTSKLNDTGTRFKMGWENFGSDFLTDIESLRDSIEGKEKKFVYYPDTNEPNYCSLDDLIAVKEIANNRYATQLSFSSR